MLEEEQFEEQDIDLPVNSVSKTIMTQKRLDSITEQHAAWVQEEVGGQRADFSYMDLSGLHLSAKSLQGASFYKTHMVGMDLRNSDFSQANFCMADLSEADLSGSTLSGAYLQSCSLRDANLFRVNLKNCDGNRGEIKSLMVFDDYPITYTSNEVFIGCMRMTYESFSSLNEESVRSAVADRWGMNVSDPLLTHLGNSIILNNEWANPRPSRFEDTRALSIEEWANVV
jgi:hypothetical protein